MRVLAVGRVVALVVLLAGPTALAFASGGYFDEGRLWFAIIAWALVAVAALTAPVPLPQRAPGRVAVVGLAALAAWTALSMLWAPIGETAQADTQRVLGYLAVLVAAAALLRGTGVARAVEPAVAAGAVVVIGYGLAGRLLPDLVRLSQSQSAFGRLEQPLTYWNAMGALAAIGFVLCVRLAGSGGRDRRVRALAAAAAAPLGLGIYLSFSRAAILAAAVGALVILALRPERRQLAAIGLGLAAALATAVPAAFLPAVRALEGGGGARTLQGLVMLGVLLVVMLGAAAAVARLPVLDAGRRVPLPRPRWMLALVAALLVAGAALAATAEQQEGPRTGATTERLASVQSNRYAYWEVAVRQIGDAPLRGLGAGGFQVAWRRERQVYDPARDAHSLYLETLTELGFIGLAALAAFLAGVAGAARRALRSAPGLAAGPAAAVTAWAVHAGLDWDWEMPALTAVALVLAGALIALSEGGWGPLPPLRGRSGRTSRRATAPVPRGPAEPPVPATPRPAQEG